MMFIWNLKLLIPWIIIQWENFGGYNVGDRISSDEYASLSKEDKDKCASAIVTLKFDPNVIYIDNNNTTFLNSYNTKTERIDSYDYINEFTFKLDSSSSVVVKFYKKDDSKDYTGTNIVNVSYDY